MFVGQMIGQRDTRAPRLAGIYPTEVGEPADPFSTPLVDCPKTVLLRWTTV